MAEHAEKQKQQAEAFAQSSRKKSIWAMTAAIVAILSTVISFLSWLRADDEKLCAEKMARVAQAGELIAMAENLTLATPDQSILIGLDAWKIDNNAKVDGHLRRAFAAFTFQDSLRGHEGAVTGALFSPDGKTILTRSQDKTARLWDAASGKPLHVLQGHEEAVTGALFSPDGKTILTGSQDKTARLWVCESCRPIDEIAAELHRRVGRDLNGEERRRFGVPD